MHVGAQHAQFGPFRLLGVVGINIETLVAVHDAGMGLPSVLLGDLNAVLQKPRIRNRRIDLLHIGL